MNETYNLHNVISDPGGNHIAFPHVSPNPDYEVNYKFTPV